MVALLPIPPLWGLLLLVALLWIALFVRHLLRDPDAERRRAAWSKAEPALDAEDREALLLGRPRKAARPPRSDRP